MWELTRLRQCHSGTDDGNNSSSRYKHFFLLLIPRQFNAPIEHILIICFPHSPLLSLSPAHWNYSPTTPQHFHIFFVCVTHWVYLVLLVWAWVGGYFLERGELTNSYTTEENNALAVSPPATINCQWALREQWWCLVLPPTPWWNVHGHNLVQITSCPVFLSAVALSCLDVFFIEYLLPIL